jgi:ApaG protein
MVTRITKGIKISVTARYQELYSRPESKHYFFSYRIRIENTSSHTVQLMRRHWVIFDSACPIQEVEGEGVVGQQPTLMPGEIYEYESACNLTSEIGSMHGNYLFQSVTDENYFKVAIPRFELIVPFRYN